MILENIHSTRQSFRPRTEPEFFALQLARRLGEPTRVDYYLQIVEHHSRERILKTYRKLIASHPAASDLAASFARRIEKK